MREWSCSRRCLLGGWGGWWNWVFGKFIVTTIQTIHLIAMMMEAISTSETSVNFYQATRRYNPENSHFQSMLLCKVVVKIVRYKLKLKCFRRFFIKCPSSKFNKDRLSILGLIHAHGGIWSRCTSHELRVKLTLLFPTTALPSIERRALPYSVLLFHRPASRLTARNPWTIWLQGCSCSRLHVFWPLCRALTSPNTGCLG
jgi:hypothetical protein